ncbi:alpha/beta fold hydrolase [Dokdonella sp.]|uniref:alpha/beta fold hydrolase n=1 Tax=Dokdonella sp. TaxID=2291710 RepID=UPI0025BEC894|nr:alpha/beta fold hydrolase [Dokdonella sp.]MBX3689912.1 alpha/beta fold hydrolase [Dokdonella sp.]
MKTIALLVLGGLFACSTPLHATCRDNVVLVHGNAGSPSDFDNTRAELLARGYGASQIFAPDWGSKFCPACNDHSGSEEVPVESAMIDAIASSCTGKIDVIGHSMGVTLAAREIDRLGMKRYIDSFVGIAGAWRGLRSCGVYPWNVMTTTCGAQGLSIGSPLITSLAGKKPAARAYSIKSWYDQIVCYGGLCTVGGVHSSTIPGEDASYTYVTGHFGLLTGTAVKQVDLIQ